MSIEAAFGAVVAVVTAVAAIAAVLDRRVRSQVDAWRGLAEARGEAEHDCTRRLDKLEAELEVLRGAWFRSAAAEIAERVVTLIREERS